MVVGGPRFLELLITPRRRIRHKSLRCRQILLMMIRNRRQLALESGRLAAEAGGQILLAVEGGRLLHVSYLVIDKVVHGVAIRSWQAQLAVSALGQVE